MIAVTGATGKYGRLVIQQLLDSVPAEGIVAAVRNLTKAEGLRQLGVEVREADYDRPETLISAFRGAEKVLLVSGPNVGDRVRQHKAVIDAAREAGSKLVAYTSALRADTSALALATEHKRTEEILAASGLHYVILRNGWWYENDTDGLAQAFANGLILGCAGSARFAAASKSDYAASAVTVLTQPGHEGRTYELAGDQSYSMDEFAREVSRQSGRAVAYQSLPEGKFKKLLLSFGLPESMAATIADAGAKAREGAFDSDSKDLQNLIGRPTTSLEHAIASGLHKTAA